MANNRGKYLLKNTAIFTLGNLGTKLISFFLVPLYTNCLSTAEYGTVDLVMTISTVLAPVLVLNVSEAVMRFALDEDADKSKIMSIGLMLILISSVLGILIVPIAERFSAIESYAIYLYFYTISCAANQVFFCYLRGKEQLLAYSIGNMIHTLAIAGLNIYFLLYLKDGIAGYFKAYILSNVITIVYAFIVGRVWEVIKVFSLDGVLAKAMTKYSVVLIPNSFMWWITDSSSRLFITAILGASANGIYAIACKIPTILSSVSGIFSQAWMYSAIREEKSADKEQYTNSVLNGLIAILLILATGVLLVIKPFMRYFVDDAYYSGWEYVPYLVLGFVFSSLGTFIGTSYTVHKDSRGYLFSAICGAVVNVIMNSILIPMLGCKGAAIASCLSLMSVFFFRVFDTRKYIRLDFANWKNGIGMALLLLCVVVLEYSPAFELIIILSVVLALIGLYAKVWVQLLKGIFSR